MSLMHFEPFRPFREMDRLANQLLSGARVPLTMPMDVWRDGQTYHVALDLPGVDPSQVEASVERSTLTVTAQRQAAFSAEATRAGEQGEAEQQVLVAERPMGTFSRQLVLGEGLDQESVQADYADGVLHLTIPLAKAARARRIQIGTSAAGQPQVIEGAGEAGTTG
jgi:HSP20 family protein